MKLESRDVSEGTFLVEFPDAPDPERVTGPGAFASIVVAPPLEEAPDSSLTFMIDRFAVALERKQRARAHHPKEKKP